MLVAKQLASYWEIQWKRFIRSLAAKLFFFSAATYKFLISFALPLEKATMKRVTFFYVHNIKFIMLTKFQLEVC